MERIEDKVLYKACEECVADAGKEDDDLVMRLYKYMYQNYDEQGKSWNYQIIDSLIEEWSKQTINRGLDGVFFRVCRDGKWCNACFSDLTEEEMDMVLQKRSEQWLKEMCKILGKTIRHMGDTFDIMSGNEDNEE